VSVPSARSRYRKDIAAAVVREAMPLSVRSYRRRGVRELRLR
jgi:hypothetical protein